MAKSPFVIIAVEDIVTIQPRLGMVNSYRKDSNKLLGPQPNSHEGPDEGEDREDVTHRNCIVDMH